MSFPRKERRPSTPALGVECPGPAGARSVKAPFTFKRLAIPLLIIPLLSLLFLSFHLLSSPAVASGEEAPSFGWPARGEVINAFRPAQGPYGAGGHAGIDISLPMGSEVKSSAPGKVSFAGNTPVGVCVSIVHAAGFKTTYVSLEDAVVRRGENVGAGSMIGHSDGSADRSSSLPHLHFGMFLYGQAVDPLPLLRGIILDPGECLFLGPWEDEAAVEAYFERHDHGGFPGWVKRGFKSLGGTVAATCSGVFHIAGETMVRAWKWTCRAFGAVGRGVREFYRRCIQPWFSPFCRGVAAAAKWVFSNRYVQALLAGLAAALVICLAVTGVALAIGLSLGATVAAAVIGGVTAVGYAFYYACTSGDSFSFGSCFLASLAVGGAASLSAMLLSYMAPLVSAGWYRVGWMGFGKALIIHGFTDSCLYTVICLITGREVNPLGVLASFALGGLMGGLGKLLITGLSSQGAVQALAAGWLSSGGALISGGGAGRITTYLWALGVHLSEKISYVGFCGCTGFLADLLIRALTGCSPSILESILAFAGGTLAGGLGLIGGGEGLTALLTRLSGGRLRFTSDLAKAVVSKIFSKGLKESVSTFLRRLTRSGKKLEKGLWLPDTGGDG
ncbi:MAG: M23 family metallopeptidase [Actinomycetota bacterium]|nr:M23 family metallopeptidase [Actinomycetota bacterium]